MTTRSKIGACLAFVVVLALVGCSFSIRILAHLVSKPNDKVVRPTSNTTTTLPKIDRLKTWHPTLHQLTSAYLDRQHDVNVIEDRMTSDLINIKQADTIGKQLYWEHKYQMDKVDDDKASDRLLRAGSRWDSYEPVGGNN